MLCNLASGKRHEVVFKYTCDSPTQRRWFQMRAAPVHDDPPMLMVVHRPFPEPADAAREVCQRFKELSIREFDVLRLLVNGKSKKQIAASLHISTRTAEKHRQTIMRKTQAANIAELVLLVAVGGVVPLELPASVDGQET
ncbi:MAG: LuxR C-terminal-related transcriptional regulator [Planctomycetota bacterium]